YFFATACWSLLDSSFSSLFLLDFLDEELCFDFVLSSDLDSFLDLDSFSFITTFTYVSIPKSIISPFVTVAIPEKLLNINSWPSNQPSAGVSSHPSVGNAGLPSSCSLASIVNSQS